MQDAFQTQYYGEIKFSQFGSDYHFPKSHDFGVLVLHGYSSSLDAVSGITPYLEAAKIDYEMPLLRGHGTKYQDLRGVTAQDWLDDAQSAYDIVLQKHPKVIIVGLSMGGLTALQLAAKNQETCLALVTWAAALYFKNPAVHLAPILKRIVKYWPGQESFNDPECRKNNRNYPYISTDSFHSLYRYAKHTITILSRVKAPICIIHSSKDQVIKPIAADRIFKDVMSPYREQHMLAKSGHELGQDLERETVFELSMEFIKKFLPENAEENGDSEEKRDKIDEE
ncbi:MAG: alpha/beta hydrolase [Bradymonadia bacterium]|jgi:carboxylesterase